MKFKPLLIISIIIASSVTVSSIILLMPKENRLPTGERIVEGRVQCDPVGDCEGTYVEVIKYPSLCDRVFEFRTLYQHYNPLAIHTLELLEVEGTYFQKADTVNYTYRILENNTEKIRQYLFGNSLEVKLYEPSGCPRFFLILMLDTDGTWIGGVHLLFKIKTNEWATFIAYQWFKETATEEVYFNIINDEDMITSRINEIFASGFLYDGYNFTTTI